MRGPTLALLVLVGCRAATPTPVIPRETAPARRERSTRAPVAGGIEMLGGAAPRCVSTPPPDGIYDLARTCDAPECSEVGRLRIAVVGGCVGLARADPPGTAHRTGIELVERTTANGSSVRSLLVDWPTFVGGCNRGTAAEFELAYDGVRVRVGAYTCAPSLSTASVATPLRRVVSLSDDVAVLLADPRREVAAAALERAAGSSPVPCDAWAALLTAERRAADPELARRALTLAADTCLAPTLEGMITDDGGDFAPVDLPMSPRP